MDRSRSFGRGTHPKRRVESGARFRTRSARCETGSYFYRTVSLPDLPRFSGGAVGYLGYDLVRHFERLPARAVDDLQLPDAMLVLADRLLVFDNVTQRIRLIANVFLQEGSDLRAATTPPWRRSRSGSSACAGPFRKRGLVPFPTREMRAGPFGELRSNLSQAEYEEAMVRRAKEYVHAGDVIQVVVAQRFEGALGASPFDVYRSLRSINPFRTSSSSISASSRWWARRRR